MNVEDKAGTFSQCGRTSEQPDSPTCRACTPINDDSPIGTGTYGNVETHVVVRTKSSSLGRKKAFDRALND